MANPSIVDCTADEWVLAAENVAYATIHIQKVGRYLATHRDTGDDAPTDDLDAREVPNRTIWVRNSAAIDVYVKSVGAAGKVVVS
jgi:hypothetical protein